MQMGQIVRVALLNQMDNAGRGPAAQSGSHHKQMQTLISIKPGDRVAEASHTMAEFLPEQVTIDNKAGSCPAPVFTVERAQGDLHIGGAFSGTGKPERGKRCRVRVAECYQRAGMGSRDIDWHRYVTPCHMLQRARFVSARRKRSARIRQRGARMRTQQRHRGNDEEA